jgi:uncharacterized membrane protein YdbT with pleckstrin-like domain
MVARQTAISSGRKGRGAAEPASVRGGYLDSGERVRLEARPHSAALIRPLAPAIVLAVCGGALVIFGAPLAWALGVGGALLLLVAALVALLAVWRWDRTEVVLTSQKLFVSYGLAQRRAAAVRLERVGAVEVEQSPLGRLLGYGTVIAGNLEIPYVPRPSDICRLLS